MRPGVLVDLLLLAELQELFIQKSWAINTVTRLSQNRSSGCNASMPLRQNGGTAGTHNGKSWTRRSGGRRGPTGRRTNPTISPESSSLTSQPPTPNAPLPRLLFTFQSTNCLHVQRTPSVQTFQSTNCLRVHRTHSVQTLDLYRSK